MSSFAKRQMEKMGWKEGEGLGKNAAGVNTYIRVERRNPALQSGLGHEAGKGGSDSSDMGLDQLLASIASKKKNSLDKKRQQQPSSDEDGGEPSSVADPSGDGNAAENTKRDKASGKRNREATPPSSSSSSSSSSSDDDSDEAPSASDMMRWKDEDLFKKCGGVRLGRGGRHRFFDGKLSRIEASNASLPPTKK